MAVRDITRRSLLSKNIQFFRSLSIRKRAFVNIFLVRFRFSGSVRFSRLDSQSKLQMFTLFTGPPTWRFLTRLYNFVRNISTNISALGQRTHLKFENCLLNLSSTISQFFDFIRCIVFLFYFLLRDSAHTL